VADPLNAEGEFSAYFDFFFVRGLQGITTRPHARLTHLRSHGHLAKKLSSRPERTPDFLLRGAIDGRLCGIA
jgi:hypothetical protein